MDQQLFAQFTFETDENFWHGYRSLKHFAPYVVRSGVEAAEPMTPQEQEQALEEMRALSTEQREHLRAKFGPAVDQFFHALEEELTEDREESSDAGSFFTAAEEAAIARQEQREQEEDERRQQGLLPIHVPVPNQAEPTTQQDAALRHLLEKEARVCKAVLTALFQSYKEYYKEARQRKMHGLPKLTRPEELTQCAQLLDVEITREHKEGLAYLVFTVECDWEQGMYVVYHPYLPKAEWATGDSLFDLLESEEPIEEEVAPPANQELVDALLARDEQRVQQLLAQGHDINDVGVKDPYPPLCLAVEQLDVELVKRLLALGADPNLKDFENKTALKRARLLVRTFIPAQGDKLMQAMLAMVQQEKSPVLADYAARAKEIVRVLEAAGAR